MKIMFLFKNVCDKVNQILLFFLIKKKKSTFDMLYLLLFLLFNPL